MTIVVDPYLIAIPHAPTTPARVYEYAQQLVAWDEIFRTKTCDYVVSSSAMAAIFNLGLDPSWTNLERLFDLHSIRDISAIDIAIGCEYIMQNYPQMEERAGKDDDIACISGSDNLIPERFRKRLHPEIASAFAESIVATSFVIDTLGESRDWSIASAPLEEALPHKVLLVQGLVVESNGTQSQVEMNWPLILEPSEFVEQLDILDYLATDLNRIVDFYWEEVVSEYHVTNVEKPMVYFGPKFIATLQDPKIAKRPRYESDLKRVFRAMVCAITGVWSYGGDEHHALRQSIEKRDTEQQKRKFVVKSGQAKGQVVYEKAVRIRATKEWSTCLHIHYWKCHDGSYEFSNVTDDHDDPTIFTDRAKHDD